MKLQTCFLSTNSKHGRRPGVLIRCLFSAVFGLLLAVPAGAQTYFYVATNGSGLNGSSWGDAYTNIQTALDEATSGDVIYVAGGTYYINATLMLTNSGITLMGGYEGSGTPGSRDVGTNATVVTRNGDIWIRIMQLSFVENVIIDGISITGGRLHYSGSVPASGLYAESSTNVIVRNGSIYANGSSADPTELGGGVALVNCNNCLLNDCNIERNNSHYGAGITVAYGPGNNIISNCVIRGNVSVNATRGGGGVWSFATSITMKNCVIVGNSNPGQGGGTYASDGGEQYLENCLVAFNSNDGCYGHGITIRTKNCTVYGNTGRGVASYNGYIYLTDSIVYSNSVDIYNNNMYSLINSDIGTRNLPAGAGRVISSNACLSVNPLLERGFFLTTNSPCVDTGSDTAANLGLAGRTTRTDGVLDTGNVDMGYHFLPGVGELYVKNTGNDGNSGANWAQAFRTITKAFEVATDGSRIHLEAGTYDDTLETFPFSSSLIGLQIVGTNSATTIIDASGSNQRLISMANNIGGRIEGVTLTGGKATSNGGAISIENSHEFVMADCVLRRNLTTANAGAVYMYGSSGVTFRDSTFANNMASNDVANLDGGAFLLYSSSGIITNCAVVSNISSSVWFQWSYIPGGGGLTIIGGAWTLQDSLICYNTALGGFRADGGGIRMYGNGTHLIKNCLIAHNTSLTGGGIGIQGWYPNGAVLTLESSTVADNSPSGVSITENSPFTIHNSILWGNGDDLTYGGAPTVSYCDIEDGDFNGANGCTNVNPVFVDTIYYHLKSRRGNYINGYFSGGGFVSGTAYSPLLDLGDPASAFILEPRPNGDRINMGAYANTPVASMAVATVGTVFVVH